MKIKFLAAGIAPDYYTIDGPIITAHTGSFSESYDFSAVTTDAGEITVESEGDVRAIRKAEVNDLGELEVTLCQRVGAGNWTESGWIDSHNYNPDKRYVEFVEGKSFAGVPTYYTKGGKQGYGGSN